MKSIFPRTLLLAAALLASCAGPVSEQPADEEPAAQLTPMEQLEKRFQEFDLNVGDPFPEVDIYDAAGKPFNTRSLRGKYTVIVNGCLT